MSYQRVADGELAAVVTYLEMRDPPAEPVPASPLSLRHIEDPSLDEYRQLFRLVGSPWLWFSRLIIDDDKLEAVIRHPDVDLYSVTDGTGRDVGMVELDFRKAGEC